MNKIIVIGCSGSGKSAFSRKLRDATGIPLHYLDMIWHKSDRTTVSREEFDEKLNRLMDGNRWILDGNFARTLEARLEKCDTVFLFDLPTEECLAGVRERIGKPREDMPWIEQEFDPDFKLWIENFSNNVLPRIYALLEKYKESRKTVIFRSRADADAFLEGVTVTDKMKRIQIFDNPPQCSIDIRQAVFVDEQGFIDDIDETDNVASHVVMFDGETAIATCRVFKKQEPDIYMMGRLAVLREYRGQGIGTQVLNAAENFARERGGSYLCLHAQCQARGFYIACGYSEYGEIEYEQDSPHIWMVKNLNQT